MEALDGRPPSLSRAGYFFYSDASFLVERVIMPAEAPLMHITAVPSRIVL